MMAVSIAASPASTAAGSVHRAWTTPWPEASVTASAAAIFAVQVVSCQWWLKHFRFGPVEWLWRSLTYLKWQPMRRRA